MISARLIWIGGGEGSKDRWIRRNNSGHHTFIFFTGFSVSFVSFSLSLPHFVPLRLIFFVCASISNSPSLSVHRLLLPLSDSDSPHAETQIANFEVWVKWQLQAFWQFPPGGFSLALWLCPMVMGRAANQALLWLFSSVHHLKESGSSWMFTKPLLPCVSATTHVNPAVFVRHVQLTATARHF